MKCIAAAVIGVGLAGIGCGGPGNADDASGDADVPESWTPMSAVGEPELRAGPSTVWTGTEMIVFGGLGTSGVQLDGGGAYDPALDQWRPIADPPFYSQGSHAWWTGQRVLALGCSQTLPGPGSMPTHQLLVEVYDLEQDSWQLFKSAPRSETGCSELVAVWTGTDVVVAGGTATTAWAEAYRLATDTWRVLASAPIGYPVSATWDGSQVLVLGVNADPSSPGDAVLTKLGYDVAIDTWTALAPPPYRFNVTGSLMAGDVELHTGFAEDPAQTPELVMYVPASNTWRVPSRSGAYSPRVGQSFVWTGAEVLVWGGSTAYDGVTHEGGVPLNDGVGYDPETDTWMPMLISAETPTPRRFPAAAWTGTELLIWSGSTDDEQSAPPAAGGARYHR